MIMTVCIAVLCLAENSVGPEATRPDDVHTMYSGKVTRQIDVMTGSNTFVTNLRRQTVEINNTDAEGRLVLADGVAYAARLVMLLASIATDAWTHIALVGFFTILSLYCDLPCWLNWLTGFSNLDQTEPYRIIQNCQYDLPTHFTYPPTYPPDLTTSTHLCLPKLSIHTYNLPESTDNLPESIPSTYPPDLPTCLTHLTYPADSPTWHLCRLHEIPVLQSFNVFKLPCLCR